MKRTVMQVALCLGAVWTACADEFAMVATDAAGLSSYSTGTNFSNHLPPSAGNTYRTANYIMRTPEGSASYVFAGDRLTLNSTGTLAWKSIGPLTVADLVFEGTIGHWYGNLANDAQLYGAVTIPAGATARFDCSQTENDKRVFRVYAPLSGSGNLQITMGHSNAVKGVCLLADIMTFA